MFASFSMEQDKRFASLQGSMELIKTQNNDITKSIEFLSAKYDESLNIISTLRAERDKDSKVIRDLQTRLESLERKALTSTIEIRNVPHLNCDNTKAENKKELAQVVLDMATFLEIPISEKDIRDINRIGSHKKKISGGNGPISVEFNSSILKESLTIAVKNFNKGKPNHDKLNTEHLKIECPKQALFLSEALSYNTKRLFFMTRQVAKDLNFTFCWTSKGVIYVRKAEGIPPIRISCETDLETLKLNKD